MEPVHPRRFPTVNSDDSDAWMRPRSHRDVGQPLNTCLKFVADDWNNVPKIVYESFVSLAETINGMKSSATREAKEARKLLRD